MDQPQEELPVNYFYLHETPILRYMVEARPPPADTSTAEFRLQFPTGKLVHTERGLKREGSGTIPFDRKKHNVGLMDSPIFVRFVFTKWKVVREHLLVVSLAEPAVGEIAGPIEAKRGEKFSLRVTQWDALAWDMPGLASLLREKEWDRLPPDAPPNVRWWLEGEKLPQKGSTIEGLEIREEHEGKTIEVLAYLAEKLPKKALPKRANVSATRQPWAEPARTTIVCPKLTIEGPKQLVVGDEVTFTARIEPDIPGTYHWTLGGERLTIDAPGTLQVVGADLPIAGGGGGGKKKKKKKKPKAMKAGSGGRTEKTKELHHTGQTVQVTGIEKSKNKDDTPVACKFVSQRTGKEYEARLDCTVTKGVKATLPIVLTTPPIETTPKWIEKNPIEVEIDGFLVNSAAAVTDEDPTRVLVQFRIGSGEHTLVISSRARTRPGARIQPPRIVYACQKVKVTEQDAPFGNPLAPPQFDPANASGGAPGGTGPLLGNTSFPGGPGNAPF